MKTFKNLIRFGGISFALQCYVRRLISFRLYEKYMYKKLREYFMPLINEYKNCKNHQSDKEIPMVKYIWTSWWQGEENAPDLVKTCINSLRQNLVSDEYNLVVITEQNYSDYIDFPAYILEKVQRGLITLTHFSDIIRAALLKKYGGVWIDATVLCTHYTGLLTDKSEYFTVKYTDKSEFITLSRWTGFLFGAVPNSTLFNFMNDAFAYYWKRESSLVVYLLIDYIIAIAYDCFDDVKLGIDSIQQNNPNIWSLLRNLNMPYDEKIWNEYTSNTSLFKLSYKEQFNGGELKEQTDEGAITYWGYIKNSMSK